MLFQQIFQVTKTFPSALQEDCMTRSLYVTVISCTRKLTAHWSDQVTIMWLFQSHALASSLLTGQTSDTECRRQTPWTVNVDRLYYYIPTPCSSTCCGKWHCSPRSGWETNAPRTRHGKCRWRWGMGRECLLSSWLGGLPECRTLPQRGPRRSIMKNCLKNMTPCVRLSRSLKVTIYDFLLTFHSNHPWTYLVAFPRRMACI